MVKIRNTSSGPGLLISIMSKVRLDIILNSAKHIPVSLFLILLQIFKFSNFLSFKLNSTHFFSLSATQFQILMSCEGITFYCYFLFSFTLSLCLSLSLSLSLISHTHTSLQCLILNYCKLAVFPFNL